MALCEQAVKATFRRWLRGDIADAYERRWHLEAIARRYGWPRVQRECDATRTRMENAL